MTATTALRTIKTAADLEVGDWLDLRDGTEMLVTHLIPATREEALEYGAREVRSLGWWRTYSATEPVKASPREVQAVAQ
ncbi:hypothetical protein [Streptosporangium jomthongense]|uniref:Uncharacterized protein n=1 Tax=Streptosporangium jomthongense TaxID=1193683 RepID=A0ABV8F8K0_9ACTN